MTTKRLILGIILISFILAFGIDSSAQDTSALHQKAFELFKEKKYEESIAVFQEILKNNPDDEVTLYNIACAYSLSKKAKEAIEYLQKAVAAGFSDVDLIESDGDLENIRTESDYKKIIQQKDKILKTAAAKKIESLKKHFGEGYTYKIDDQRKLIYASDASERLLEKIRRYMERFADNQRGYIFKNKPTYYLTILAPNKEDFQKIVPNPNIGGFYQHQTRTLFCRDTGFTLRHEFTHALHFADNVARKQECPVWITEGLATCFEESTIGFGKIISKYNGRIDLTKKIINTPAYIPWQTLMKLNHGQFMKDATICYAEARSIFYWLNKTERLPAFYNLYIKYAKDDVSGAQALEKLLDKKLEEIEKIWKQWIVKAEPPKILEDKSGVFLGVKVEPSVVGMIITEITPDSPAEKAKFKVKDVILQIGEDIIGTNDEFIDAIRKRKPGQQVIIYILREDEDMSIRVALGKRDKETK
jgi:tetratricopeptide (TPR) repeat protein